MAKKALTTENLNPNVFKLDYAIRGPLTLRAMEITKELQNGVRKPFKRLVWANQGDAQALGQKPITFFRQVLACATLPELIETGNFPEDVKKRAKECLSACLGNSVGSYSQAHGIETFRRHVAEYIERRDGHPSIWEDVYISSGSTESIRILLKMFCNTVDGKPTGVMVPVPQYPIYTASLAEYGLTEIGYYLDEDHDWSLDMKELERARAEGAVGSAVRALVIINPGNPTGQVLTRKNIEDIIRFAYKHKLFILADEVYQDNVFAEGSKFYSLKKVLREMGEPYASEVELASFMSVSKGYTCECGFRGGWVEVVNMDPDVQAQLFKTVSAKARPSTLGQIAVDLVAKPPQPDDPSYELFLKEKTAVLESMKLRAKMVSNTLSKMEGLTCNVVQGAMYALPRLDLPPKAIEAARAEGKAPDVFYAFKLLEETGISVVAGCGFGQRPGTYHIRTTILPQPDVLQDMLNNFQKFHKKFTAEYSS